MLADVTPKLDKQRQKKRVSYHHIMNHHSIGSLEYNSSILVRTKWSHCCYIGLAPGSYLISLNLKYV